MPFASTALAIGSIIAAGVGGTEMGLQLSGAGQPSTPKASTTPSPLTAAQNQNQQTAVGQSLPNLQSITGGSLSPEYAAQFGALQSGTANDPQATGNIQAAINQFFGLNAPGQSGLTSSSSAPSGGGGGILDLLSKPTSGGTNSAPSLTGSSPGIQGWIQQQLQGNNFTGLQG